MGWFDNLLNKIKPLTPVQKQESKMVIKPYSPQRTFDITFEDTEIIRHFEGHSLKAYPDPATKAEPYTISWGLTGPWVKKDLVITQDESNTKFMEYLEKFCKELDSLITIQISKNQYLALLSFAWNLGIGNLKTSTLLRLTNKNDPSAPPQFMRWTKAAGKEMAGLVIRRWAERASFKGNDWKTAEAEMRDLLKSKSGTDAVAELERQGK